MFHAVGYNLADFNTVQWVYFKTPGINMWKFCCPRASGPFGAQKIPELSSSVGCMQQTSSPDLRTREQSPASFLSFLR